MSPFVVAIRPNLNVQFYYLEPVVSLVFGGLARLIRSKVTYNVVTLERSSDMIANWLTAAVLDCERAPAASADGHS